MEEEMFLYADSLSDDERLAYLKISIPYLKSILGSNAYHS